MNPAPTESLNLRPWMHFATGIFGLILVLPGCTGSTEEHDHIVYYHKPAGFNQAVLRLDEIHTVMTGKEPLPGPRQFEDTSHDHHHDEDSGDHEHEDHEHDDEHEMVEVNIFQEWHDIVRWLPTIAGETDLPKKHWDEVNALTRDLARIFAEIQAACKAGDQNMLRKFYVEKANEIGRIIQALKDMIPVHDEWDRKVLRWIGTPTSPRKTAAVRTPGVFHHG